MKESGFWLPVLIYLAGVLASAFAQILLKKEAMRSHDSFLQEYLNPRVITGYAITFGCTMLTILSYRFGMLVSWSNVLESMGYLFVTALGVLILHEHVSRRKWRALLVIIAGVAVFALGSV